MHRIPRSVCGLLFATALCATTAAEETPEPTAEWKIVSTKLDLGGNALTFTRFGSAVEDFVAQLDPLFRGIPDPPFMPMIPGMARASLRELGANAAAAYGTSLVELDSRTVRKKSYVLVRERAGLFALLGGEPRELESVKMIPADAVSAYAGNLDPASLLPVARSVARAVAGAAGEGQLDAALAQAGQALGVDARKVIDSLGDEVAFFARVDPEKKMSIVVGPGATAEVARSGLVVLVRTKDPSLFEAARILFQAGGKPLEPYTAKAVTAGARLRKVAGFPGVAVIAQTGNWFAFATDAVDLEAALAGGPDIRTAAEFRKFARGMPEKVSAVSFRSARAGKAMAEALERMMNATPGSQNTPPVLRTVVAGLASLCTPEACWRVNEPKGFAWVTQGESYPYEGAFSSMGNSTAVAGMAVAIAVPAFLRARENSRGRACQENLSKLDGAKEQYALEKRVPQGGKVDMGDLVGKPDGSGYLRRVPVCPSGGTYTLNPIGKNPECSIGTASSPFEPHVLR